MKNAIPNLLQSIESQSLIYRGLKTEAIIVSMHVYVT